ncbi:hypothetical protein [Streptomyces nogalater]|uniref:Uncharacterized protein n=1 Tax=Streptomyces nogalater TaxID=38314 RepID=A0ABW0W8I7_STRNO
MATPTPPSGPTCTACGETAVVHWQRRPTADEVAAAVAVEQDRREHLLLLADIQLPAPEFGPLPTARGMTRTVYACAAHAISLAGAALIHDSTCTAPNPANLPGCNCTPETPEPAPLDDPAPALQLPDHWFPGSGD